MAQIITDNQHYTNIANAIREKNGGTILYKPNEMANAIKELSSLNFKVVGGTTQPRNPAENTIWINTSTSITGYIVQKETPSNPSTGLVWLPIIGSPSTVKISVLEDDSIFIYPKKPKIYSNRAWREVNAMAYIGGQWVKWSQVIHNAGKQANWITDIEGAAGYLNVVIDKNGSVNFYPTKGYDARSFFYAEDPIEVTNTATVKMERL